MGAAFSTTTKCDGAGALPPIGTHVPELPKSPGQFERVHEDVKKLTNVNTFEGAKFEVSKPLTPMFALNHLFLLGSSPYPNANSESAIYGSTLGGDIVSTWRRPL